MHAKKQKPRSDKPRKFFSRAEQAEIVAAIEAAERRTSGEIRLYVEREVPRQDPGGGDATRRSQELFSTLGIHQTAERNGVLIYLATHSRRFAVVGDTDLHRRVGKDFWDDVVTEIGRHFAADAFVIGVTTAIAGIGEKLRVYFPQPPDDVDELSNDISYET